MPIWRKVEKPPFFCHFKRIKGDYRRLRFKKNPLGTFLSPIHVLPNCKVSEKSNEQFLRNCVTGGCTNGRMKGRTRFLRSQTTSSRDYKTSFLVILRGLKRIKEFFKNLLGQFFVAYPCSNCKVSETSDERFCETTMKNRRMNQ